MIYFKIFNEIQGGGDSQEIRLCLTAVFEQRIVEF